jgi:hypothetical protein
MSITYTGLKGNKVPNKKCFYERYRNNPNFDHMIEENQCYDPTCKLLAGNPGKDPIETIYKASKKKISLKNI